jgi:hypothetical protein
MLAGHLHPRQLGSEFSRLIDVAFARLAERRNENESTTAQQSHLILEDVKAPPNWRGNIP